MTAERARGKLELELKELREGAGGKDGAKVVGPAFTAILIDGDGAIVSWSIL